MKTTNEDISEDMLGSIIKIQKMAKKGNWHYEKRFAFMNTIIRLLMEHNPGQGNDLSLRAQEIYNENVSIWRDLTAKEKKVFILGWNY